VTRIHMTPAQHRDTAVWKLRTVPSIHGVCVTEQLLEGPEALDGGKWALYCEHPDGIGIVQDTNRRRLWSWARHSAEWCCYCQEVAG